LPKIVEKSQIKTKRKFSDSINSMIAKKAFDLWQKAEKNNENEWKTEKQTSLAERKVLL